MYNFTICVPTRERPKSINRLIKCIRDTAKYPDKIQIIFRIDKDDKVSKATIDAIKSPFKIDCIIGDRGNLSDMWEDCWETAKADLIMMCADDVIFRTKNWDDTILQKAVNPKDTPYFIWGNDKIQGAGLATLPIMSRKWVELVGYFVPRGYAVDYCDTHLDQIARLAKKGGVDVMTYFNDIVFEHMHPNNGKAPNDKVYQWRRNKQLPVSQFKTRLEERQKAAQRIINWRNPPDVK